ncbi:MAG TPA: hypothetical protein VF862_10460 [Gemmatimonadales bacterium]
MRRVASAGRLVPLAVSLLTSPFSPGLAQAPPRYAAATLACAVFEERVRTEVRAQEAGVPWEETGDRFGRLVVRARPEDGAIDFEAWYDSLTVRYDARAGRLEPDTDGLIGGRWEGRLTATGSVELLTRPFMPPDLREVSDLSDALLDFLPPLPAAALAPGSHWTDSLGLTVRRLADSTAAEGAVARYEWTIHSRGALPVEADSTLRIRQEAEDEGRLAWGDDLGVLGWTRRVTIETQLARAGRGGSSHRGRVVQQIRVRRITSGASCG